MMKKVMNIPKKKKKNDTNISLSDREMLFDLKMKILKLDYLIRKLPKIHKEWYEHITEAVDIVTYISNKYS